MGGWDFGEGAILQDTRLPATETSPVRLATVKLEANHGLDLGIGNFDKEVGDRVQGVAGCTSTPKVGVELVLSEGAVGISSFGCRSFPGVAKLPSEGCRQRFRVSRRLYCSTLPFVSIAPR